MKIETIKKGNELIEQIEIAKKHHREILSHIKASSPENTTGTGSFERGLSLHLEWRQNCHNDLVELVGMFIDEEEVMTLYVLRLESHIKKLEKELEDLKDVD